MHKYLVLWGRPFVFYKPASFHFTLPFLRSMLHPGTSGRSACLLYIKISKVARHYGIFISNEREINVKVSAELVTVKSSATLQNYLMSHSS